MHGPDCIFLLGAPQGTFSYMAGPIVQTACFASADNFLRALSPFDTFWRNTGSQECWSFRGVSDADLPLQAKAFRQGELKSYGIGVCGEVHAQDQREHRHFEAAAVMRFAGMCIDAGLPLPEDGQWLRNTDLQVAAFGDGVSECQLLGVNFPFPLYRSLYALAQHYGVPTRLLDWTLDPFLAAYFACAGLAREQSSIQRGHRQLDGVAPAVVSKELCVWALRTAVLGSEFGDADPGVDLVNAPAESNPNLRAQKGIFTLVKHSSVKEDCEMGVPDLETLFRAAEIRRYGEALNHGNWPLLRKHVLPHSEARHLLRLLAGAKVTVATIDPTYRGAAEAMRERQNWSDRG